jgi:hypothetical protein
VQPEEAYAQADDEVRQEVVVPLARTPIKPETISVPFTPSEDAALMHTLRIAAARGASTVYVVAQSKPMIRVDGEIGPLETEPTLTAADVDRLVLELRAAAPDASERAGRVALRRSPDRACGV